MTSTLRPSANRHAGSWLPSGRCSSAGTGAPFIIRELDNYVAPGSPVLVVAEASEEEAELAEIAERLRHETVTFRQGDTTDRHVLDSLDVQSFDHIIVLRYSDLLGTQEADARTLITLLHLRDVAERTRGDFSIVREMLDMRNRELAADHIRVNWVTVGWVATPNEVDLRTKTHGDGATFLSEMNSKAIMGRLETVEDIAEGVAYLVSDQASHVTGCELNISGGMFVHS